jgi:hypothetical protein
VVVTVAPGPLVVVGAAVVVTSFVELVVEAVAFVPLIAGEPSFEHAAARRRKGTSRTRSRRRMRGP